MRGLPLSHKTQSTHEKRGSQGSPLSQSWKQKKTISFSFSSIIFSPKKGGFKGEDSPPCRNGNKKHYCFLYLLASHCLCLLLFSLYLIVCVVFIQPTQPPTYTIQPVHNATNTQPPTYTMQPINE